MLDYADILVQIQRDTQTLQKLLFVFVQDYLLPVFEKHPELPDVDIHIHIKNDQPGTPYITFNTRFHAPKPELVVTQQRIGRIVRIHAPGE